MTPDTHAPRPGLISAPPADLCLAYANTLSWRGSDKPVEALRGVGDLLGWIERSADHASSAETSFNWTREDGAEGALLFADAIALRETIHRVFRAVAEGHPVPEPDFVALNLALAQAPTRHQLARVDGGYAWRIEPAEVSAPARLMPALLAPVLWSAADLLSKGAPGRIRQCANETCLWLFVDGSKSGTRRWCDMTSCGNRAKARRHYSKTRQR